MPGHIVTAQWNKKKLTIYCTNVYGMGQIKAWHLVVIIWKYNEHFRQCMLILQADPDNFSQHTQPYIVKLHLVQDVCIMCTDVFVGVNVCIFVLVGNMCSLCVLQLLVQSVKTNVLFWRQWRMNLNLTLLGMCSNLHNTFYIKLLFTLGLLQLPWVRYSLKRMSGIHCKKD